MTKIQIIKVFLKDPILQVSTILMINGAFFMFLSSSLGPDTMEFIFERIYNSLLIYGIIYRIFILKPLPTTEAELI